jgi:hypothetical protein
MVKKSVDRLDTASPAILHQNLSPTNPPKQPVRLAPAKPEIIP